jgi:hypothetical protein
MFDPVKEHKNQQNFVDWIERLNGGAARRIEWAKLRELFDVLTDGCPFVLIPLDTSSKFARARVIEHGSRPSSISEIGPIPSEKCKDFGRCHRPGQPVLYAGIGTELVLAEVGAKPGDTVALLHMRPKRKLLCVRAGALNLWRRTSGSCLMDESIKAEISRHYADARNINAFLMDGFIADQLSRQGNLDVYKLTSAYVTAILESHRGIAGVIYSSADFPGGTCIALKDEIFGKAIEPTEAQLIQVTSYLGYGIYDFKELARTKQFDEGSIVWNRA